MSLSDALNELKEDLPENNDGTLTITEEAITLTPSKESRFKFDPQRFDPKVVEKFNTLYNVISTRKVYKENKLLDKSIAQEVFTMLPDVSKTESAKLTNYPSSINREVIEKALSQVEDKVPTDSIQLVKEFIGEVNVNKEHLVTVKEFLTNLKHNFKIEDDRLINNKSIIITQGESKNLYTSPLYIFSYMDDTVLDYEKYSGKLAVQYRGLIEDETLKTFISYYDPEKVGSIVYDDDFTLANLVEKICHITELVNSSLTSLEIYIKQAESIRESDEINETVSGVINNLKQQMDTVDHLKMIFDILEVEDNFFIKLENLLKFLD